jgi:hypothetical protein
MPPSALRTSYAEEASLLPFFSGGAAKLSPDGRTLAAACGDDAQLVDAAGGAVRATLTGDSEPVTALAFRRGRRGASLRGAVRSQPAAARRLRQPPRAAISRSRADASRRVRAPAAPTAPRCTPPAAACSAGGGR